MSDEAKLVCPYCPKKWPMSTKQEDLDAHMEKEHPGKPWKKKRKHYRAPGVYSSTAKVSGDAHTRQPKPRQKSKADSEKK